MAASPAASSRRSPASSSASLKPSAQAAAISVDTLVNHLLVAKRSLSSMNLVLRANEIATAARNAHEDSVILDAQNRFLAASIVDQIAILLRVRRSIHATYEWGRNDFKKLVRAMDEVDGELAATMDTLRGTEVRPDLRPAEGERRNLLDFVDETGVHAMREAMKKSIEEFQGIQQSFDGDLLRFDTDIRTLKKVMADVPLAVPDAAGAANTASMEELLLTLDEHSSTMAQLLTSLTHHFDMCVTAIRTTEGAAALARRKAAEGPPSQDGDGVSISGVIAEQESHMSDLEPKTAEDRAEMLKVVMQDADEVDDVVREIQERLAAMETESTALEDRARETTRAHAAMSDAFAALGDVGDRLPDYLAAEGDFRARWELEKDAVFGRLRDMRDMRHFYDGYASAYASLVLEVERRRTVDRQVEAHWRKAREGVARLLEADAAARDSFRHEVGEFLPTDLWAGVQGPARKWKVVPADGEDDETGSAMSATDKSDPV